MDDSLDGAEVLNLGENGGVLSVRSATEIATWLNDERQRWQWAEGLQRHGVLSSVGTLLSKEFTNLANHIESARQSEDHSRLDDVARKIKNAYLKKRLLHTSSPEGKFIQTLHESFGEEEAGAALLVFLNSNISLSLRQPTTLNGAMFRGFTKAVLFANDVIPASAEQAKASLMENVVQHENQMSAILAKLRALAEEHVETADAARKKKKQFVSTAAKYIRNSRDRSERQIDEGKAKLADLEHIYNEKLSLDAPVEYWKRKKERHDRSSRRLFVAFGSMLIGLLAIIMMILYLSEMGSLAYWQTAGLGAVALATLAVGVAISIVRVPLRLAMSELHLKNDADERVTMVETYLALRKGEHATADHMHVVLERLFRPVADGIVKDDLGPATPVETLSKALTTPR